MIPNGALFFLVVALLTGAPDAHAVLGSFCGPLAGVRIESLSVAIEGDEALQKEVHERVGKGIQTLGLMAPAPKDRPPAASLQVVLHCTPQAKGDPSGCFLVAMLNEEAKEGRRRGPTGVSTFVAYSRVPFAYSKDSVLSEAAQVALSLGNCVKK